MTIPAYANNGPVDCATTVNVSGLKGKSVLVTGGSSGLGEAYVKAFVEAGAYVTNADIKPAADSHEIPNSQFVQCDCRSWSDQLSAFKAAIANSPNSGIDIVVANAGVSGSDTLFQLGDAFISFMPRSNPLTGCNDEDESEDPIEPDLRIIKVNFIGVVYTTKLAMHYFNKQPKDDVSRDRCLILKSSLAGYVDVIGLPSYESAKFGVRGLMCNLRRTGRMRVNIVAPWFIATPLMSDTVVEKLSSQLSVSGSEFAHIEDSVAAVLRVAADGSINGRAFGIVPRSMCKEGYSDLEKDDHGIGSLLGGLQDVLTTVTHRTLPAAQQ